MEEKRMILVQARYSSKLFSSFFPSKLTMEEKKNLGPHSNRDGEASYVLRN